jgi:ADP-heptose:LPS heptosyltransferase
LTTPVLKALRENFPQSHIAIMVSAQAEELVEDNPYIDEVIVYDKDKKDRGLTGFLKFALALRKKRFDLAIVLHTKKRTELITFLADIPKRIGYGNRKFG